MSARDAVRSAHRKLRPAPIRIVAGQDHPELVEGEPAEGRLSRFGPFPLDYAEPDEELPAAARPMFDTLSKILLGSILALALAALAVGFSLGGG